MSEPTKGSQSRQDDQSFVAALSGADDLGCVIRATIHIENLLISSIEQVLPNPKELDKLSLDYHGRVSLAVALGMPPEIAPALRALGKLRNRFAHRVDTHLVPADASDLYNALPSDHRAHLQDFLRGLHDEGFLPVNRYAALSPRNQLTLIAISLRRFLLNGLDAQRVLLTSRGTSN